jgi:hypothetical protein
MRSSQVEGYSSNNIETMSRIECLNRRQKTNEKTINTFIRHRFGLLMMMGGSLCSLDFMPATHPEKGLKKH